MYRHKEKDRTSDKSVWMLAIRDSAYDSDHVALRRPVRWRLLRRIWAIPDELPCGLGRWMPF